MTLASLTGKWSGDLVLLLGFALPSESELTTATRLLADALC
jgi:hypothetical protein